MTGYLSRLVARDRAKPAQTSIVPFVRTESPLRHYDQRIGLVDAPLSTTSGEVPPRRAPEDNFNGETSSSRARTRPNTPVRANVDVDVYNPVHNHDDVEGSPVLRRERSRSVFPPVRPPRDAGAPVVAERTEPQRERVEAPATPKWPGTSELSPPLSLVQRILVDRLLPSAVSSPRPGPDSKNRASDKHPSRESLPQRPLPLSPPSPAPRLGKGEPAKSFRTGPPLALRERGDRGVRAADEPPRTEESPRPTPPVAPLEPRPRPEPEMLSMSGPLRARRSQAHPRGTTGSSEGPPTVTIDSLRVEVMPPAAPLASPRAPMTAAEASVIGPVRPALRSALRFGLRRR